MFRTRRRNCVRSSVWSLLSEGAEHLGSKLDAAENAAPKCNLGICVHRVLSAGWDRKLDSSDRKIPAVFPHPQNTTVGTLLPLSPVPGGRGFLWISDTDSMFTQATLRPWQRQTLSWRRTHLREDFSVSMYKRVSNNSNLGGVDVFSN